MKLYSYVVEHDNGARTQPLLRQLSEGSLLVFYAGLKGWNFGCPPALYSIGCFEVARAARWERTGMAALSTGLRQRCKRCSGVCRQHEHPAESAAVGSAGIHPALLSSSRHFGRKAEGHFAAGSRAPNAARHGERCPRNRIYAEPARVGR